MQPMSHNLTAGLKIENDVFIGQDKMREMLTSLPRVVILISSVQCAYNLIDNVYAYHLA